MPLRIQALNTTIVISTMESIEQEPTRNKKGDLYAEERLKVHEPLFSLRRVKTESTRADFRLP